MTSLMLTQLPLCKTHRLPKRLQTLCRLRKLTHKEPPNANTTASMAMMYARPAATETSILNKLCARTPTTSTSTATKGLSATIKAKSRTATETAERQTALVPKLFEETR